MILYRSAVVWLCLVLCFIASGVLSAQEDSFSVEIAVLDQSPAEYANAVRMGLEKVIVDREGNPVVLQRPEIQEALQNADSFVEQYRYFRVKEPVQIQEIDATPAVSTSVEPAAFILSVVYSEDAVIELTGTVESPATANLGASGPALLWLLVEQGGASELIGGNQQNAVAERIAELADESQLDLVFPLLDLEDRQALGAADVRGGFEDRIREASARYDVETILTAVLSEQPGGMWLTTWRRLAEGGNPVYTNSALNLDSVVASGVEWIAETGAIAKLSDTVVLDSATGGTQVWIGKIDSTDRYAKATEALLNMADVEDVTPVYLVPEGMLFSVSPRQSPSRLQNYLDNIRWLQQTAPPDSSDIGNTVPANADLFYDYAG